jgi:hypothetical protein
MWLFCKLTNIILYNFENYLQQQQQTHIAISETSTGNNTRNNSHKTTIVAVPVINTGQYPTRLWGALYQNQHSISLRQNQQNYI